MQTREQARTFAGRSLGVVVLAVFVGIAFMPKREEQPPRVPTAEEKAADERMARALLLVTGLRDKTKNPAAFDLVSAVQVGPTLCVVYRGTNSFNAVVRERAVIDTKTGNGTTDGYAWNSKCAGKIGDDLTGIRWGL